MNKNILLTLLSTDGYKTGHRTLYPKETTLMFSNLTPRSGNWAKPNLGYVVAHGMRYVVDIIRKEWDEFFKLSETDAKKIAVEYSKLIQKYIGVSNFDTSHFIELHKLGKLPIEFRALPEGTLSPYKLPVITFHNTDKRFAWLVNYLETKLSAELWPIITASTTSHAIKLQLARWAEKTGTDLSFVNFQAHDFSQRGVMGTHAAQLVGMGHLHNFDGTDNLPALLEFNRKGSSVIATEHSIASSSTAFFKEIITEAHGGIEIDNLTAETQAYRHWIEHNQKGVLSLVSDTWNIYDVCDVILPSLKKEILNRDGKLVIRPDSGDSVEVLLGGFKLTHPNTTKNDKKNAKLGLFKIIEKHFGSTINAKGYKVLPITFLWGEGMTPEKIDKLYGAMAKAGYASENVIIGVGSYAYQFHTRDTHGIAVKATYAEFEFNGKTIKANLLKDPITDSGVKKSATGLLVVNPDLTLKDKATWVEVKSKNNLLRKI